MPALHLSSSFHLLLLIGLFCAAAAWAWFFYRITIPPISETKRFVLIALRGTGLFFLMVLIGEPLLSVIHHTTEQPAVAVLIDRSQSMAMKERIGSRASVLRSVVSSDVWKDLKSRGAVSFFQFDSKIKSVTSISADSLVLNGAETNISEVLRATKKLFTAENLQAVVLVTDGISTVGAEPLYDAEDLGVPVYTVGVGDTSEQKDVLIRKVLINELTYAGNRLPVNVTVHSAGFGGEHVQVMLKNNGKEVDQRMLTLEAGSREYAVALSCIPEQEGLQKYTVELSLLPGELTAQNNRQNVFVKVLKSKMRVALVASAPSEDVAFIRRALESDKNIDVQTFIEHTLDQPQAHVLDQKFLTDADCVVVVGFPVAESISGNIYTVFNTIVQGKPFLFVASRTIDFIKLKPFEQCLPFTYQQRGLNEEQVFALVNESQQSHSILKTESNENVKELWDKLPPVFRMQGLYHVKPEAAVLAMARIQSTIGNDPLIVIQNVQQKKSEAILAYGIWRWQLLSDAGSPQARLLERMLVRSIRWLTTREDDRRIRVQPSKDVFPSQEPVEFTAQVYDENYQPVDDAQIEVQAVQGKESFTLALTSVGSGQYRAAFDQLPEGDYQFTARVQSGGKELGASRGVFSVGGANAEFLETRMNQPLLQQIAARTGGKYYNATTLSTLPQDVAAHSNFKPRELTRTAEIELWNSRWMLALVIVLFSIEWFLRKQSGML